MSSKRGIKVIFREVKDFLADTLKETVLWQFLACQVIRSGNRSWGRSAIENVTFCF